MTDPRPLKKPRPSTGSGLADSPEDVALLHAELQRLRDQLAQEKRRAEEES